MSVELAKAGPVISSDANRTLIALYEAVAEGWQPPEKVTEDEYRAARAFSETDPRKAFFGFGCSFGAKWFGGFARSRAGENFAGNARSALLRDIPAILAAPGVIRHADFLDIDPTDPEVAEDAAEAVLYLDPPYAGTEPYGAMKPFDHARFWERVRQWARVTDVFVSEYAAPFGRPVLEFTHELKLAGGGQANARRERLYHFSPTRPT